MMKKMLLEEDIEGKMQLEPLIVLLLIIKLLEDDTFTIRDRDSMEQKRINLSQLLNIVDSELTIKSLLKKLDN